MARCEEALAPGNDAASMLLEPSTPTILNRILIRVSRVHFHQELRNGIEWNLCHSWILDPKAPEARYPEYSTRRNRMVRFRPR